MILSGGGSICAWQVVTLMFEPAEGSGSAIAIDVADIATVNTRNAYRTGRSFKRAWLGDLQEPAGIDTRAAVGRRSTCILGGCVMSKNIVLVHGGFVDGSGWKGVYDVLSGDGYDVS